MTTYRQQAPDDPAPRPASTTMADRLAQFVAWLACPCHSWQMPNGMHRWRCARCGHEWTD